MGPLDRQAALGTPRREAAAFFLPPWAPGSLQAPGAALGTGSNRLSCPELRLGQEEEMGKEAARRKKWLQALGQGEGGQPVPPLGSGSGCCNSRRSEGWAGVGPGLSLPEPFPFFGGALLHLLRSGRPTPSSVASLWRKQSEGDDGEGNGRWGGAARISGSGPLRPPPR